MKFRFRHQLFVERAVESTEEEGLFARLLYLTASLTKALKHRFELCGRETAGQDVTMLTMLAKHTIASSASQGEGPAATFFVSLTKFNILSICPPRWCIQISRFPNYTISSKVSVSL